jgi:hypothetical protein
VRGAGRRSHAGEAPDMKNHLRVSDADRDRAMTLLRVRFGVGLLNDL